MKRPLRKLTLIFFVAVASACASNEKDFQQTLQRHLHAVQDRDLGTLMATVADSVTLILPDGATLYTKAEFEKLHVDWFQQPNWTWTPTVLKTTVSPSECYAMVDYQYDETDSTGAIASSRKTHLLLIFRKMYGQWLLVHDQNTRIE